MLKRIIVLSAVTLLAACAHKPFVAQSNDFDNYFEHQIVRSKTSLVVHADHGQIASTDEPYKSVNSACTEQAFSGKSFLFGSHKISDPNVLNQMSHDYAFTVFQAIIGKKIKPHMSIFNDKSVIDEVGKVIDLDELRMECIKKNGWGYAANK
jgi:hypothetical protein